MSSESLRTLISQMEARVILHIDMDAFYCQVEQRLRPELRGKPMAVVQYNPNDPKEIGVEDDRRVDDSDGSLIAVSYEARAAGVKRQMRGKEARKACPELVLVQVPVANKKSHINLYREAGAEVVTVLSRFATACERSSIDEVYVDITTAALDELSQPGAEELDKVASTWVAGEDEACAVGTASKTELRDGLAVVQTQPDRSCGLGKWWGRQGHEWTSGERLLAAGAAVAMRMRRAVLDECSFTCSAGISHNKILAKLGSGLHKPNQQTILPTHAAAALLHDLPLSRIRGLGGDVVGGALKTEYSITTVGELLKMPYDALVKRFGDSAKSGGGIWIWRIARGVCLDPVSDRELARSRGTGKNFEKSKTGLLHDHSQLTSWLTELCSQLLELLELDRERLKRVATSLTVTFGGPVQGQSWKRETKTRSRPLMQPYSLDKMVQDAVACVCRDPTSVSLQSGIGWLYLTATNFYDLPRGNSLITSFMKRSDEGAQVDDNDEDQGGQGKGKLDIAGAHEAQGTGSHGSSTHGAASDNFESGDRADALPLRQAIAGGAHGRSHAVAKGGARGARGERSVVEMLRASAEPATSDEHAAGAADPVPRPMHGGGEMSQERRPEVGQGEGGEASAGDGVPVWCGDGARPATSGLQAGVDAERAQHQASGRQDPPGCRVDGEHVSLEVLAALPAELRQEIQINMRLASLSPRKGSASKASGAGVGIKRFLSQGAAGGRARQEQRSRPDCRDGKLAKRQASNKAIDKFFLKKA